MSGSPSPSALRKCRSTRRRKRKWDDPRRIDTHMPARLVGRTPTSQLVIVVPTVAVLHATQENKRHVDRLSGPTAMIEEPHS